MVSTKAEVLAILEKNKEQLKPFGVQRFSLFGSFLFNQVDEVSDVDLLVDFQPGQKNFSNFSNLIFFLEELFERRVDVVTSDSLSPYIGPHILADVEHVEINS